MIGTKIGPYEVTAKLGEGGMGEVWRARDSRLERDVAIKVLPSEFTADADRLARFEREAQLLAQLQHPNIASIYGLEESGGVRGLVMELVPGPTLAERLAAGAIPVEESLAIAREIAEALEAAHAKGIVHRDLKPQNVKLAGEGKVKVLDFGLAKAMDATGDASGAPSTSPTLMHSPTLTAAGTQLGVILGTAAYMAPEQARGGVVDKRADVWAFGVVLYETLTGRSAFLGDTVPDTLAAVLTREIDFAALPPATPPAIRRLLRRCLERKPKNRLHDVADARLVIDDALAGVADEAAPTIVAASSPAPLWRRTLPWLGGALVGLAAAWLVLPRGAAPPEKKVEMLTSIRMLVAAGESADPDVSPDGRTLAFASERGDTSRVWIKDLASGSESALARHPSWLPRFSPDGTSVLFNTGTEDRRVELYRIALATREERLVARDAEVGDWSPDGGRVSFLRGIRRQTPLGLGYSELVTLDLASGEESVIYQDEDDALDFARWSPDGRRVAVVLRGFQTGEVTHVGLVDPTSGAIEKHPVRLPGLPAPQVQGTAWLSPHELALLLLDGGSRIAQSGRIAVLDVESGELRSVLPMASIGWGLATDRRGSLFVGIGSTEQNLREARREGPGWRAVELLTEGPFSDRQPVYSPDSRSILFTSDRGGNLDIWRLDRASGELRRLTDHEASDWDPALSPDGRRLAFSSNRSGRFQIWIADAEGVSPRQLTNLENAQNPTMTGDGEWIVFTLQDAGEKRSGLWKVRPDGSDATLIAAGPYLIPDTSPDGRFVAFRWTMAAGERLLRVADGRRLEVSIPFTDRFRWSVEGGRTYLWAIQVDERGNSIVRFAFDPARETLGPKETILAGEAVAQAESLGVAHDGSAIAFSSFANRRAQIVRIDGLADLAQN
ncbi:MAG: protein kinase [Acidobacteria bacterium]|nr:protein kinase [Acidobacteriota bacterium]